MLKPKIQDAWYNALAHLRICFSFFLLPPFLMSLLRLPNKDFHPCVLPFFILHFFIYPASNGHNSFYDKDTDSIGGLAQPPPVSQKLFWISWALDTLGILLSWTVSQSFAFKVGLYSLISQAYSHSWIRLKKYPWISFWTVVLFQGAWIIFMLRTEFLGGIQNLTVFDFELMGLASLFLCAAYPLSQIYQHSADKARGDLTLSRWLGIKNTWIWCQTFTLLSVITAGFWIHSKFGIPGMCWQIFIFSTMSIVLWLGLRLRLKNFQSEQIWSHARVMRIQKISAGFMILFWLGLVFLDGKQ